MATHLFSLDDERLAAEASSNPAALEVLLERHWRTAFIAAFAVLNRREDASDVAQETLLRVAEGLRTRWQSGSLRGWVAITARRLALNACARERARKARESACRPSVAADACGSADAEGIDALREELASLPEVTGQIIAMYHIHAQNIDEISRATGLSADACRQRLVRGRRELARRLERRGIRAACLFLLGLLASHAEASAGHAADGVSPESDAIGDHRVARPAFAVAGFLLSFVAVLTFASVSSRSLASRPAQPSPPGLPEAQHAPHFQESDRMTFRHMLAFTTMAAALTAAAYAEDATPAAENAGEKAKEKQIHHRRLMVHGGQIEEAPIILEVGAVAKALESQPADVLAAIPGDDLKAKAKHLIENTSIKKTVTREGFSFPAVEQNFFIADPAPEMMFFKALAAAKVPDEAVVEGTADVKVVQTEVKGPGSQEVTVELKKDADGKQLAGAEIRVAPQVKVFKVFKALKIAAEEILADHRKKECEADVPEIADVHDLFQEDTRFEATLQLNSATLEPMRKFDIKLTPGEPQVLQDAPEKLDEDRYIFRRNEKKEETPETPAVAPPAAPENEF
ncbi:MAG TPA: sigma-70 family RNA polymerase sigma factor [Planctomycetota bacterium]|nr:sigma-70 family RNA polymerase sigma factor [Planctomycetota bacterium]